MTGGNTNHYTTTELEIALCRRKAACPVAAPSAYPEWGVFFVETNRRCLKKKARARCETMAAIAQLGERQTEDLKVPGSIPGLGIIVCVGLCDLAANATKGIMMLERKNAGYDLECNTCPSTRSLVTFMI